MYTKISYCSLQNNVCTVFFHFCVVACLAWFAFVPFRTASLLCSLSYWVCGSGLTPQSARLPRHLPQYRSRGQDQVPRHGYPWTVGRGGRRRARDCHACGGSRPSQEGSMVGPRSGAQRYHRGTWKAGGVCGTAQGIFGIAGLNITSSYCIINYLKLCHVGR